jgi:sugar phosphate isomerase/epimerase
MHNRRTFLESTLAAVAGSGILASQLPAQESSANMSANQPKLRPSIAHWCFELAGEHWSLDKTCAVAKELGCPSVELVLPSEWHILKKHGLICAMTPNGMPDPPFQKGFNNPRFLDELVHRTKGTIDLCADGGSPNAIAFIGFKWIDPTDPTSGEIDRAEAADQCVRGLKQVVGHAEAKNVNICIEILNTRDVSHPMKGHPGYQGDDLDLIADVIRRVGSPNLKVLFDVYHVQVMNGDLLRRIDETKDIIGHIHVAGNPGRGELDGTQEINYAAVTQKLLDVGYNGYVGIEFLPTREPIAGLRAAIEQCCT